MLNRFIISLFIFFGLLCSNTTLQASTSLLYGNGSLNSGAPEFLPVEQAFIFSGRVDQETAFIDVEIAPEHYLYKHRFSFSPVDANTRLGISEYPPGEELFDPYYQKNLETFSENFTIQIPAWFSGQLPEINISFQGCAKAGLCYPPHNISIPLVIQPESNNGNIDASTPVTSLKESSESDDVFYKKQLEEQIFAALLLFFLAGIGLSFTPCVLPMFPILSSLILGNKQASRGKIFSLSFAYIISMSLTFAIAGTLMGLFGASLNLQAQLQSPWFIYPMAGLFVALSLSMFGLYELQLPASVRDKFSSNSSQGGRVSGAVVMGVISALVVSPCVSAPLAGALIYISTTGDAVYGGLTLFALGVGMGVPLLLFALGGRQLLPKAGEWMNSVRAVFGVLLLGVSIWMLERVTPPSVPLFLWGALFIGCAVYLGALNFEIKNKFKQTLQTVGLVFLVFGICLIVGSAMGNHNPLNPLARPLATNTSSPFITPDTVAFDKVSTLPELNQLLQQASRQNQPVMVDLYADWCVSCKIMERNVFPDPLVSSDLAKLELITLDITKNTKEHQQFMNEYQLFGPPALLFFNPEGEEVKSVRTQGQVSVNQLKKRLEQFLSTI